MLNTDLRQKFNYYLDCSKSGYLESAEKIVCFLVKAKQVDGLVEIESGMSQGNFVENSRSG